MKVAYKHTQNFFIIAFILTMAFCLASLGIFNTLDAYATRFGGTSSGIGGANDVGNGGFCTINPSDPSCPSPQPTDCTINPSDPSCPSPQPTDCTTNANANNSSCTSSCPTIALAMPCYPPPASCTKGQHFDAITNKCVPDNCSAGFEVQKGTCVRKSQRSNSSEDSS